jgi:hypothetical protein
MGGSACGGRSDGHKSKTARITPPVFVLRTTPWSSRRVRGSGKRTPDTGAQPAYQNPGAARVAAPRTAILPDAGTQMRAALSISLMSVWTRVGSELSSTPGLGSTSGRFPDFTSRTAVYAIRTYGGQEGGPRDGTSFPDLRSVFKWLAPGGVVERSESSGGVSVPHPALP